MTRQSDTCLEEGESGGGDTERLTALPEDLGRRLGGGDIEAETQRVNKS